ncbi:hypothetical protein SASPL_107414 [Salvia splendens]|uniref:DNA replication licensing factor MCM2 n=1 Tax=Salvia splendens TaxID=180675 RepID=A0A8X8YCV6_SALSN|nr:hypothetical protein SASPL_107414 [Salvia splendens]
MENAKFCFADSDDESYRPSERTRADFRPPATPGSMDDTDGMASSPGRSRGNSREDVPMTDQTDDVDGVQGTLREWVTKDEVRRFIGKKFKGFLLTYVKPKSENEDFEYLRQINEMVSVVTRRSGVFPQLQQVKYDCNKCGAILGPFVQNSYSEAIYRNYQKLTLQESPGIVPAGRLPRYKEVILLNDLIDCAQPGEEIEVTGIYTTIDLSLNTKGFPVFATVVEANYVVKKHDPFSAYKLTQEDTEEIQKLAKDPRIGERIAKSIAPFIYGHEDIKAAIALAMYDEKSGQRAVYTTGKGASAVGLTAAVHRDPVTREWILEGDIIPQKTFSQNVDLTDPIVSRFDILCVVKDVVDPVTDEMLTQFVVDSRYNSQPKGSKFDDRNDSQDENQASAGQTDPEIIPQEMLKKYLTYAKLNVFPKSHDADFNKLTQVYAELRRESSNGQGVPIAVRHIESMIRMSEAHARMHLRNHVIQEDVDMAIRVLLDSFISIQKFGVQKALQKDTLQFEEIATSVTSNLSHVDVKVEELQSKALDYGISDLKAFFSSTEFSNANFELDEEQGIKRHRLSH